MSHKLYDSLFHRTEYLSHFLQKVILFFFDIEYNFLYVILYQCGIYFDRIILEKLRENGEE